MKALLDLADAFTHIFTTSDVMNEDYMEAMLGVHYEKYKIFVRSMLKVDEKTIEAIKEIECISTDTRLELVVKLDKSKQKKFTKHFKTGTIKPCSFSDKEFRVGVTNSAKSVNIYIENVGFLKEVELYESRLDCY